MTQLPPGGERMAADGCRCRACADLRTECGEVLFPLYAKKLRYHGWAGSLSPAGKAYRSAHSRHAQRAAERMKSLRMTTSRRPAARAFPTGVWRLHGPFSRTTGEHVTTHDIETGSVSDDQAHIRT